MLSLKDGCSKKQETYIEMNTSKAIKHQPAAYKYILATEINVNTNLPSQLTVCNEFK